MFNRFMQIGYVLAILTGLLLGWLVTVVNDEASIAPARSLIVLRDAQPDAELDRIHDTVAAYATSQRVNIAQLEVDPSDPDASRVLYLFVGDDHAPSTRWLTEGYPGFSQSVTTTVLAADRLGATDPRAYYYVMAPVATSQTLGAELARLGVSAQVESTRDASAWMRLLFATPLWWAGCIVALTCAALVGAAVLGNTQAYGTQRLLGRSFAAILGRDLRRALPVAVGALVVGIGILTTAGLVYTRGHQWTFLTGAGLFIAAVLTGVALAAHVTALALTQRTTIVGALKGELTGRASALAIAAVRVPSLVLVVVIVTGLMGFADVTRDYRSQQGLWQTPAVFILTSGTVSDAATSADPGTPFDAIGAMIRDADRRGEVLISHEVTDQIPWSADAPRTPTVVTNATHLDRQPVLTTDGSPLAAPDREDEAVIGIPTALWPRHDAVVASVVSVLEPPTNDGPSHPVAHVEAVELRPGQTVFTYGAALYDVEDFTLDNPIVVALPIGSPALSDDILSAWSTSSGLAFTDRQAAETAITAHGLSDYVAGIKSVSANAAQQMNRTARDMRVEALSLAAGAIALAITSAAIGVVFAARNSHRIFVRFVHGWPSARIIAPPLVLDGLLGLAVAMWGVVGWIGTDWTLSQGYPPPDPRLLPTAVMVALVGVGLTVVALHAVIWHTIRTPTAES